MTGKSIPDAAWADRSQRARIHVAGPDRAKFLHNLTTNDVKGLLVGSGCEAFVTSPQGKTLAFVTLHALDDSILLRTEAAALLDLLPHLAKYSVFDDVAIENRSDVTQEVHVFGPEAGVWLRDVGLDISEMSDLAVHMVELRGQPLLLIAESPLGEPGWTLIGPNALVAVRGLRQLSADQVERMRIVAGTPEYGKDVTAANLPQELDRNDRAIHFQKGCYLGQETVARLDALGHVNKILRRLIVETNQPVPAGAPLFAGDKPAGTITSTAAADGSGSLPALGIIRVAHANPGSELVWRSPEVDVPVRIL